MSRPDEKVFFDYLMLNQPTQVLSSQNSTSDLTGKTGSEFKKRTFFNLKQLDKIVDFFTKEFYTKQQDKKFDQKNPVTSPEQRLLQRKSLADYPNTTLELLLVQLQQKIRVMFPSQYEAFRFFDIRSNQKCTKEHFVFTCHFLHLDHNINEIMELFQKIDTKQDGVVDETEFANLFKGAKNGWNSHEFNILESILRDNDQDLMMDIGEAFNTI